VTCGSPQKAPSQRADRAAFLLQVQTKLLDLFWEKPFTFSGLVHRFCREEMIDAFAGRVYETEHQPSRAILAFRKMLARTREYEHEDDYSIPIGSRFHPGRAAIWEPNFPLPTTEEWMSSSVTS
jgi:hypothetical protein